jgi:DnaJ-class molecular chaperone
MTREEAREVLGPGDVNEAFRRISKECHPNGQTPDLTMWEMITEAKAVLLAPPPKCLECKGTGRTTTGHIRMFCPRCGGTGQSA